MVGVIDSTMPAAAVIDRVLAAHPDVASALRDAHDAAWGSIDPTLVELCRLRIAQLLGDDVELAQRTGDTVDETTIDALRDWPTSPCFGARERACLAMCEQWVIDVANITPAQTSAVAEALGPQGLADFAASLLVIEQRLRLHLAWTHLFADTSERSDGA